MTKMRQFAILLMVLILSVSFAGLAEGCIELKAARASYLPGETVQVEISAGVTRTIAAEDISIYRNSSKLPTAVFISKINDAKYFAWFDLPNQQGTYSVRVRGYCPQLKTAEIPIDVRGTIGSMRSEVMSMANNKWKILPLESHILAAGIFYNESTSGQADSDYIARADSCMNSNCSTKNASLTLAAFSNRYISAKMLSMLETYRNSEKYNTTNGTATNGTCWGSGLNESCNATDTAYALLALAMTGNLNLSNPNNSVAVAWLKNNAKNIAEKAAVYYITKNNETLAEILGLQDPEGFWLDNSKADARTTALAIFALKSSGDISAQAAAEKSKTWLKSQKFSLSDECFALFFGFPASETEPIVSIWPGLVKTSSKGSFDIILTNKGMNDIKATASLFNSSAETIVGKNSMKNMQFKMPLATTTDGRVIFSTLAISYQEIQSDSKYLYSIPLIIFTEKGASDSIGPINTSESIINNTGQQEIINGTTSNPLENKTAETNTSLIQEKFVFDEKNISLDVNSTDSALSRKITLANYLDGEITDIEISPQINLQQNNFVKVEPRTIQSLGAGMKANITVYIDPSAAKLQTYHGYVQASGKYKGTPITSSISIYIGVKGLSVKLQNCSEMGGADCSEGNQSCGGNITVAFNTNYCCIPAEKCTTKAPAGRNIGLIIVLVIIVILIVIILLLKRKPKKEMRDFLEEKAKEYEMQKVQRPSSIERKI